VKANKVNSNFLDGKGLTGTVTDDVNEDGAGIMILTGTGDGTGSPIMFNGVHIFPFFVTGKQGCKGICPFPPNIAGAQSYHNSGG
jgi:hypothetical protein